MISRNIIRTERLILREIEVEDAYWIAKWRSDPEIYCFFKHPHALAEEEHLAWYQNVYLKSDALASWIAVENDGQNPVGIYGAGRSGSSAKISYLTSRQFQNRGYGAECIRAVMRWCTDRWGITGFYAEIHAGNQKSIQFIQRLGFHKKMINGDFILFEWYQKFHP